MKEELSELITLFNRQLRSTYRSRQDDLILYRNENSSLFENYGIQCLYKENCEEINIQVQMTIKTLKKEDWEGDYKFDESGPYVSLIVGKNRYHFVLVCDHNTKADCKVPVILYQNH